MSVHKIRLFYSLIGSDQFHQWLIEWHDSVNTHTTDLITNEIPNRPISQSGGADNSYYAVTFTYPTDEDRVEILKQPYQKLTEYCAWSQVAYHKCGDVPSNAAKSDCSHPEDAIYRDGGVPEHIPPIN
jgi:hypothetical protein